jgi:hypothetical protein
MEADATLFIRNRIRLHRLLHFEENALFSASLQQQELHDKSPFSVFRTFTFEPSRSVRTKIEVELMVIPAKSASCW